MNNRVTLLSLCVVLAVVAASVVEAAPQREKRQLLGGILGFEGQQLGGFNQGFGGFNQGFGGFNQGFNGGFNGGFNNGFNGGGFGEFESAEEEFH